ncbi:DUF488 family protein [Nitrospira moscoviensis]|uniref:DUF488 family protein n=1 Tax=Nitrospira moscoviensis TaxID=42253 RepID=A0A0K2GBX3_NITMO|nr:DUF488 family protein [Nitrospira moscoviensis]ALA58443.1 hypothetical protein NITMOv2_2026 [Nitrospira moscoviensis]
MSRLNPKRIDEPAAKPDGFRVLVVRLWPRGISKAKAKIDLWLPEYLQSIREARREYKAGRVKSHADVFGR